ncbi:MAG TPA: hypothetical protein VLI92_00515 [Candidatus Saccharimonadales bacterium]|nr:hypothetical protein [Candidatus Saccharimonadales bacterium]
MSRVVVYRRFENTEEVRKIFGALVRRSYSIKLDLEFANNKILVEMLRKIAREYRFLCTIDGRSGTLKPIRRRHR